MAPVLGGILDNAKTIDPEIPEAQANGEGDSVLECFGEFFPR
jgi:hypothetical protein